MDTVVLERLGLSKAEIKVYLALIEIGVSTTGPLCKRSGIPSSNMYSILDNLAFRGLVSYSITSNKKYFKAEDPNRLKELLLEQKNKLLDTESKLSIFIPELAKKYIKKEKEQELFVYEGIKGIKTALEFALKVLNKGSIFHVVDASKISNERLMGYFNDFHKRRVKKGIKYEVIYGVESLKYAKERKKYLLTEVKILPKEIRIPSVFWIFNGYVVISVFSDEPFALMIKSNKIYESFMSYFRVMSKISRRI